MARIGVVGLGAMGLGIAQVYAQAGFDVVATDAHSAAREAAADRVRGTLDARVAAGKLAPEARDATLARLHIVDEIGALAGCDMVVEAIVENPDIKSALLRDIEGVVAEGAILATNTSALSVAALAESLRRPDRVLGLHFFNPAPVMRLVELVAHEGTAPDALSKARTLTEAAGKTVIACADRPGFIVNRCARPFYGEALALIGEGRTASEVDAAMIAAGYRMGPLSLIDLIGADVHLAATEGMARAMHDHPRYHVFAPLRAQVASGQLGRKTGRGFLYPETPGPAPADAEAIRLRIEATLANEAASLLAEGAVSAADIDRAMKLGLNFPRGPFESARAVGLPAIRAELNRLAAAAPAQILGRYDPVPALAAL